jgi:hypothetical protein
MTRLSLVAVRALVLGCGSVAATSVCGCDTDGCEERFNCEGGPTYHTCTADPAAGRLEGHCGIFVSSGRGDDAAPGTPDRPVRTMARAIALAQAGPQRIYACAETFADPVELPSGIGLWGGLDCANGWTYIGTTHKTAIAPEPGGIPAAASGARRSALRT